MSSRPVRLAAVAAVVLAVSAGTARADVIKFQQGNASASPFSSTNDTYTQNGTNHGGEAFFKASSTYVGLLSYPQLIGDASGQVPAGAVINSAVLQVCLPDAKPSGGYPNLEVFRVTAPWTESATTAPSFDASSKITFAGSTLKQGNQNFLNVTSIVQAWAAGTPNYGLLFKTSSGSLRLGASENTSLSERPSLVVDYKPKPPAAVPAPPGLVLAGMGFGCLLLGRLRRRSS